MNLIPIDEVVEMWVRAHLAVQDSDLDWWREAMAHLAPEDDATLEDEDA